MPELEDANNELNNCNILENKCTLGFYDEKYIDDINISPIKIQLSKYRYKFN